MNTAPYPRHRYEGNILRPSHPVTSSTWTDLNGSFTKSVVQVYGGNTGSARVCDDVVVPQFRKRVSEGQVINNPLVSIKSDLTYGGTGPINLYIGAIAVGATFKVEYDHACTHYFPEFLLSPMATEEYNLGAIVPDELRALLTTANTAALANVDTSLSASLVSLGELNATLGLLMNPLGSISKYMSRYKWRVRKGRRTVELTINEGAGLYPCLANQYLAWYYGLQPLIRDLQSILDAYVKSGYQSERITARGKGSDEHVESSIYYSGNYPPKPTTGTWYKFRKTETTTVVGRSGILYEPSRLDWRKVYGFRIGDVPAALWDLTPWSFFLDYFGNFSKMIGALSPRSGIDYLAAWEVGRLETTTRIEVLDSGVGYTGWTQPRKGTEWVERTNKLCFRSPKSPYAGTGIQLSLGNWEQKTKVLAVASLIIQQLSKSPMFIWRA